jgi:hypothetical protein
MNKKVFIGVALMFVGMGLVNAQEVGETRVIHAVAPMMGDVLVKRAGTVSGSGGGVMHAMMIATGSRSAMPAGQMPFPTTGDATKDAQIKALITEMNTRIQAIHTEYETKLKAIIGDKAIINSRGSSSSSPGMMRVMEVREAMMDRYDGEGTSTQRMHPSQGRENENRPMYIGERQNYGGGEQRMGYSLQIGKFLRGLFGGEK